MKRLYFNGIEFTASLLKAQNTRVPDPPRLLISAKIPGDPLVPGGRCETFAWGITSMTETLNQLRTIGAAAVGLKSKYNAAIAKFLANRDVATIEPWVGQEVILLKRKKDSACEETYEAAALATAEFYRLYLNAITIEYGGDLKPGKPIPFVYPASRVVNPVGEDRTCILGPAFIEDGVAKIRILQNGREKTQPLFLKLKERF